MTWTVSSGDRILCPRCAPATTFLTRLRGLLGRDLPADAGLLIRPANSVHMMFMRYPIDAVFLDREDRVMRVAADLAPWRLASRRGAKAVLELPAGTCARVGIAEGDMLTFADADPAVPTAA